MDSSVAHLQVNIDYENVGFYRELIQFFGWETAWDEAPVLGCAGKNGVSLWFIGGANGAENDYDGRGVNHVGISVGSQSDVDEVAAFLSERGVEALFDTPRHRPEFSGGEDQTYYQVMFETPDRVLIEVVYTGPKA